MNKKEFLELDIIDKIDYLNKMLIEGYTVKEIRQDIGISEKVLQRTIKENNYKYNQKLKQYTSDMNDATETCNYAVVEKNTIVVPKQQEPILSYLENNFEVLKEFIEKYKTTTRTTTETTTNNIVINLVDDKHLNPKPKSIRINEHVYKDWQEFCDQNKYYSKQDLISMALKEYMEKYK